MIRITIVTCIILLLQGYIGIIEAITCASNPCGLVAGIYDGYTGYCCIDTPPTYLNAICRCPNNVQTINTPCRYSAIINPIYPVVCSLVCYNGGVCSAANGQQICVCPVGFGGLYCEVLALQAQCPAGYTGPACNQRYFSCPSAGVFPDTPRCAIGRFFYCPQTLATPGVGTCPAGQRFNRFTSRCDYTYQCT